MDNPALEKEADEMGEKAAQGKMSDVEGKSKRAQSGGYQSFSDCPPSMPDYSKLSYSEVVRYLLEAAKASPSRKININDVFKNFTPHSDGSTYGIQINEPVTVTLGGRAYDIALMVSIMVNKNGYYNPIINLDINNPKTKNTRYGTATGYNYGTTTSFYLLIYGSNYQNSDAFEKWYGWNQGH